MAQSGQGSRSGTDFGGSPLQSGVGGRICLPSRDAVSLANAYSVQSIRERIHLRDNQSGSDCTSKRARLLAHLPVGPPQVRGSGRAFVPRDERRSISMLPDERRPRLGQCALV
jgi:hypothetical protein